MAIRAGRFLTFEGVDGAGKSTHVDRVCDVLRQAGVEVCQTREPGGTALSEKLRELLLHDPMHLDTETLLMFAARCEHLKTCIEPALAKGQWVVCDRFTDATFAYQGGGRQLGVDRVKVLANWVHPGFAPDRTWFFDVPLDVARQRLSDSRTLDRFEQEQEAFFERTRAVYLNQVSQEPERFKVIDGTQTIPEIAAQLKDDVLGLVKQWQGHR